MPYRGDHADGPRSTTTVPLSTRVGHAAVSSSALSARTETKNDSSPRLNGRAAGTSNAMMRNPLGAVT